MKMSVIVTVVALTAAGGVVAANGAQAAGARPSAVLTVAQANLNTGGTEKFGYSGAHLPSKFDGYLQQLSGKKWKTVVKLGAHAAGTASLKLTPVAADSFRVVFTHAGAAVAVSKTVAVAVLPPLAVAVKGVTTRVGTGQRPVFKYTVADLASGQGAQLQRQFGTAGTWRKVAALGATKLAVVTAPALTTLGEYPYRIAIVQAGKVVKSTAAVTAYAYGSVALTPFGIQAGTVQVGSVLFSYTNATASDAYPAYNQNTAFATATSCRSLTVQYAPDSFGGANIGTAYLEFVQKSSDAVYVSDPAGDIGSVTVALDGGPLYMDTANTYSNEIVSTITGSCYTVSGTP